MGVISTTYMERWLSALAQRLKAGKRINLTYLLVCLLAHHPAPNSRLRKRCTDCDNQVRKNPGAVLALGGPELIWPYHKGLRVHRGTDPLSASILTERHVGQERVYIGPCVAKVMQDFQAGPEPYKNLENAKGHARFYDFMGCLWVRTGPIFAQLLPSSGSLPSLIQREKLFLFFPQLWGQDQAWHPFSLNYSRRGEACLPGRASWGWVCLAKPSPLSHGRR